jgi:hypothetical protein
MTAPGALLIGAGVEPKMHAAADERIAAKSQVVEGVRYDERPSLGDGV